MSEIKIEAPIKHKEWHRKFYIPIWGWSKAAKVALSWHIEMRN